MTFIDIVNYIFIPDVLKFRASYGTINRGFLFAERARSFGENECLLAWKIPR